MTAIFPLGLDSFSLAHASGQIATSSEANDMADAVNKIEREIRGGQWYNVKHYGALGNDSADETAAFSAVMAAAGATGGRVWVPPGIYRLASTSTLSPPGDGVGIVVPSNVSLVGSGWRSSVIKPTVNNTSAIHLAYGATNISISGLTCDLRFVPNVETDGIKIVNNSSVSVREMEVIGGRIGFQCIKSTDIQYLNCIARDQIRTPAPANSGGFSCTDNVTYNGNSRVQYANCISLNSEDFGWTINGASSGNIITGIDLVNCLVYRAGFRSDGSHTATTAGYGFQATNAVVSLTNCRSFGAYEFGFILQAATHDSRLIACHSIDTAVGGASSGSGFYLQGPNDASVIGCQAKGTVGRGFRIQNCVRPNLVGNHALNSSGGNGYGIEYDNSTDIYVGGMILNGNVSPSTKTNAPTFRDSFFGANQVLQQSLAVAASDPATTQTLANSLRTALINLGLGA